MADHGVAAQVELAAWCSRVFGLDVESFGRAGTARKDSCKLVLTGRHLLCDVTLDGGWIFLSLSLMDKGDPPDNLVTLADGPEGWHTLAQLISAFERHNVKSLARPIEFGNPGGSTMRSKASLVAAISAAKRTLGAEISGQSFRVS
jgi:hypothetical protein